MQDTYQLGSYTLTMDDDEPAFNGKVHTWSTKEGFLPTDGSMSVIVILTFTSIYDENNRWTASAHLGGSIHSSDDEHRLRAWWPTAEDALNMLQQNILEKRHD